MLCSVGPGIDGWHEVLVVADVWSFGSQPSVIDRLVAQRMRRRLDDEGGIADFGWMLMAKRWVSNGIAREARLEHELPGDQIDLHFFRVDFARAAVVQCADVDLAVVGLGVQKRVGELDLLIDAFWPRIDR